MSPITKNVSAVVAGIVVGWLVNMGLVQVGHWVVPAPQGADLNSIEGIKAAMAEFTPVHFLPPFLAHALGTLAGAFTTAKIAASKHMILATAIGACFFIGGIMMIAMVGGPLWFCIADPVLAYFPMGLLGGLLGKPKNEPTATT